MRTPRRLPGRACADNFDFTDAEEKKKRTELRTCIQTGTRGDHLTSVLETGKKEALMGGRTVQELAFLSDPFLGLLGSPGYRGEGTLLHPTDPSPRRAIPVILRKQKKMASKWKKRQVERRAEVEGRELDPRQSHGREDETRAPLEINEKCRTHSMRKSGPRRKIQKSTAKRQVVEEKMKNLSETEIDDLARWAI